MSGCPCTGHLSNRYAGILVANFPSAKPNDAGTNYFGGWACASLLSLSSLSLSPLSLLSLSPFTCAGKTPHILFPARHVVHTEGNHRPIPLMGSRPEQRSFNRCRVGTCSPDHAWLCSHSSTYRPANIVQDPEDLALAGKTPRRPPRRLTGPTCTRSRRMRMKACVCAGTARSERSWPQIQGWRTSLRGGAVHRARVRGTRTGEP